MRSVGGLMFCSVLGLVTVHSQAASAQALPGHAVELARRGTHATVEGVLAGDLAVRDSLSVDADGDGDVDQLLTVETEDSGAEPKPEAGRGLVLAERTAHGWRGHTIASQGLYPRDAGYNWGGVEALHAGAPPLLRVEYSAMQAGRAVQRIWLLSRDARGGLHTAYSAGVRSTGTGYGSSTVRSLEVRSTDLDGDGQRELTERVREGSHCSEDGCVADGALRERTRVLRWRAETGRYETASREAGQHGRLQASRRAP